MASANVNSTRRTLAILHVHVLYSRFHENEGTSTGEANALERCVPTRSRHPRGVRASCDGLKAAGQEGSSASFANLKAARRGAGRVRAAAQAAQRAGQLGEAQRASARTRLISARSRIEWHGMEWHGMQPLEMPKRLSYEVAIQCSTCALGLGTGLGLGLGLRLRAVAVLRLEDGFHAAAEPTHPIPERYVRRVSAAVRRGKTYSSH